MAQSHRTCLLDTGVILEYIRGKQKAQDIEEKYALRKPAPERHLLCIVSVGEIGVIARRNGWGEKKKHAMDTLLRELDWVDLSYDGVLSAYEDIEAELGRGITIDDNDKWIAAATIATNAFLLTTDRHFEHIPEALLPREVL